MGALLERDARSLVPALGGLVTAVVVLAVSFVAPSGRDTGADLDVAAVQGGGEQGTSALDEPSEVVTARHLDATRTIEAGDGLEVSWLWPENVIDTVDFATSTERAEVAAEAQRLGVPIAVGVTEDVAGQPGRFFNAQVIVRPDGAVTSRYDKVRRVPFGEYVPLRGLLEALGAPIEEVPSDAVAGTGPAVLDLPDGTRLAVAISWEVFFGGRVREGVEGRRTSDRSTRRTVPATPARSCRPSRSRPAASGRSRRVGGWCRSHRRGSPSSSRPMATCCNAPASASRR